MKLNVNFSELYTSKAKYKIEYGGAGSGKSYGISQKIILDISKHKHKKWLVIRKVGNTLRHSVFSLFNEIINRENLISQFTLLKSTMEILCDSTGSAIICSGLDDPEKIKSIASITDVWIEETSELVRDDFIQLVLRVRDFETEPEFILSFNPIDESHWLKEYFFDRDVENCYKHHSTYRDNAFLPDSYIAELKNMEKIDYNFYRVYTLGEWGKITKARIFHNIKFIQEYDERILRNIRYGLDFGYNDPNTLIGSGWYDGCLYIFKEFYAKKMINKDFIDIVDNSEFEKDYTIIADSSRPDLIEEWSRAGFEVYASKKGKDSVQKGVDFLKQIPYIYINEVTCPNAAREFRIYKYRELKDGRILDEPVDLDNHTIDAVRYANEDLQEDVKPVFTRGLF